MPRLQKMPIAAFVDESGRITEVWRHYLSSLAAALATPIGTVQTAAALAAEAIAKFAQAVENSAELEARAESMQTGPRYCVGSCGVMTHSDDDVTFTHGFNDFTRDNSWHKFYSIDSTGYYDIVPIVDAVSYHSGTAIDSIDAAGMASPLFPFCYGARYLHEVDRL